MYYSHKCHPLLLLLSFILLFNNTYSFANNQPQKKEYKGCYTKSDCKSSIDDPWEDMNRKVFIFNDYLDQYFLKPLSQGYHYITPKIMQRGVNNFYKNLQEPVTSLNALLQRKGNVSGISITRFLINSTLGLGGLLDVAGELGLKRFDEDFNQTLAVWGVESGNYIVLPFFGPSSVRGGLGLLGDYSAHPLYHYSQGDDTIADPFTAYTNKEARYSLGISTMYYVDQRASLLKLEKQTVDAGVDRYSLFKSVYYQNTQFKIYDGDVPEMISEENTEDNDFEDELDDLLE